MQASTKIRILPSALAFACLASCASVGGGVTDCEGFGLVPFDEVAIAETASFGFEQAEAEIGDVVEELNRITRRKDYSHWLLCLEPTYKELLSDSTFLEELSDRLPKELKERNVKLASIKDYFDYVFVPSRKNARVDSIYFADPDRAYAVMDLPQNRSVIVYILQKEEGGSWKLAHKN